VVGLAIPLNALNRVVLPEPALPIIEIYICTPWPKDLKRLHRIHEFDRKCKVDLV
jgi:hypothetical protein